MESPVFSCQDRCSFFCLTGTDGTVVSWSLQTCSFSSFLGGPPISTHPRIHSPLFLFPLCCPLTLGAMVASHSSGNDLHADGSPMTFQVFEFPGGAIQWARYRNNANDYLSIEEEAFGSSLNSQRSQMSFGTLRIKSSGLRAPHWHFNANEHGYLDRKSVV